MSSHDNGRQCQDEKGRPFRSESTSRVFVLHHDVVVRARRDSYLFISHFQIETQALTTTPTPTPLFSPSMTPRGTNARLRVSDSTPLVSSGRAGPTYGSGNYGLVPVGTEESSQRTGSDSPVAVSDVSVASASSTTVAKPSVRLRTPPGPSGDDVPSEGASRPPALPHPGLVVLSVISRSESTDRGRRVSMSDAVAGFDLSSTDAMNDTLGEMRTRGDDAPVANVDDQAWWAMVETCGHVEATESSSGEAVFRVESLSTFSTTFQRS